MNFDGNDYVTIPRMNYDENSVSAWFNKNTSGTTVIFGGFRYNAEVQLQEGFDLYFLSGTPNRLRFIVATRNISGTRTVKEAIKDFTDSNGSWYHVVGTYNKATGEQKLYVDGQLVNTQTHPSGNVIVPLTERNYMAIGTRYTDWGFFRGSIDDVRIFNRALSAQEALSLFNDTASPDTTPPTVSATSPVSNTTGVAVDSVITATFNEAMDAGSITPSTFMVSDGSSTIGGTVSYSGTMATFTPSGTLAYSITYTATVTTGVTDLAGNAMAADYTWSFTTTKVWIKEGDEWRYFKGTKNPPLRWEKSGFDDSNWQRGPSGFGYGRERNKTNLGDMRGNYLTVYVRRDLVVNDPHAVTNMTLSIECDGPFIAYLNGREIIRNVYGLPGEQIDVSGFIEELLPGENILAVEGSNDDINSDGFSFTPEFKLTEKLDK